MLLSLAPLALAAVLCQPTPLAPARLHGHLAHAPAGDTVRLSYGRHYGPQAAKTVLDPAGNFVITLKDLTAGTLVQFSYAGQRTSLYRPRRRRADDAGFPALRRKPALHRARGHGQQLPGPGAVDV